MTSYLDSATQNHGLDTQVTDDERDEVTEEYINAVHRLWEGS
jgi:alkanesulfonate monooxygenase SsuD/methylene tetrahydromethanopterin reductase-like flavin-dependent oxidoreductase (luciferase family)